MPLMRLKTVVLPEPLGPMRPTISPSSIRRERSSTARRPPKSFVRPSVSRSAILRSRPAWPRLLDGDRLHLLEPGPFHLVEVDDAARHVALFVERDRYAEDALVVLGCSYGVAHGGAIRLADLLDGLQDDVGGFVGQGTVGTDRPVPGFEGLDERRRRRDLRELPRPGPQEDPVVALGGAARGLNVVDR